MSPPHRPTIFSGSCDWDRLERVIERFEDAWQQGRRPVIDEYLRGDAIERDSLVVELVHTDLECRLKAGEAVRVESYFERYRELAADRERALGLIAAEYDLRRRREPGLTLDEYLRRFPQYADELATRLQRGKTAWQSGFPSGGSAPPSSRICCPRCHNPVEPPPSPLFLLPSEGEKGEGASSRQMSCPSCGSSFRLDPAHPLTWSPERLTRLGKFDLLEAVGRGAFGTVYRAHDRELDRLVAVKVPRGSQWISRAEVERFIREARNAARLAHPGIVPVYEAGQSEALPYIVTAFVEGETLAQAVADRRFGFRETAEIIAQVAEALEHAHRHGVIHRDLKPSNILLGQLHGATPSHSRPHSPASATWGIRVPPLTSPGGEGSGVRGPGETVRPRAFVTDFGLARREEGDVTVTVEGQILGTPAYMSPEQAGGRSHQVDGRTDVYSLGVILYELLTGEVPFRGVARMVLRQIIFDEPRPPRQLNDKVPRDLEIICLKAMAKEPGRRYATAGELAADLRRYLRGEPIRARPVGRLEKAWRWTRRNPWVAGLSATVAVLLVALAAGSVAAALVFRHQRDAEAEARRQAVEARQQADHNAEMAQTAQAKAEANAALAGRQRDLALETLEKLVYEIQTHLKDRPGLHALREDLLAGAIDGLDRVARDKDFRPDLSTLNARTLLGEIYLGLGRTEDARRQLERSRGLAESLIADDPENALARRELGRALCKLGAVHLRMGDAASARALHEKAAALHRALLPIDPQPPLAQWDLLLACSNLGDALIQLGEPAKAREQYTEALKFAEALTAADPSNVDYQIHQASCRERLGEVCLRLGDPVAALDHHRKALAQREELARERPGSLFIRRQVMTSCRQIGDLHFKRGDLTAAEPMYRRAYELCTATLQVDPQYFQVRFDLALCWERLGDIRQQRYDYPEAERYYRQALEEYERLAAADSANVQPRRGASVAHEKLGRVCRRRGHWQAALDHGRQAVRQREALARANPENVETQTDLAAAYGNLALAALEAGNFAEAVDHYSRGLDLLQQLEAQGKLKDQPQYQNWLRVFRSRLALSQAAGQAVEDLAFALRQPAEWVPELLLLRVRTLAGRGSHAEAAATAEALRARAPDNATNLYNVACCYALCARGVAAGKAPADLAADESAARTEYIRRAMEALTQAVRRGYRNGLHLRTDPDLAILHDAEGFQELLGQLTQDRRQESGDKDPKP